jgi:hypothetical protein
VEINPPLSGKKGVNRREKNHFITEEEQTFSERNNEKSYLHRLLDVFVVERPSKRKPNECPSTGS